MSEFIDTIFSFFYSIYDKVFTWFYENNQSSLASNFLTKQVFDGELLSMGMTWEELVRIVMPWIMTMILIFLVFKVIWKMLFGKVWR